LIHLIQHSTCFSVSHTWHLPMKDPPPQVAIASCSNNCNRQYQCWEICCC
jgi:hypothetical protein